MTQVGVREVRDKLSKYLRLVRRGERVVITDRGRPVAALVGLGQEAADEVAWSLVRHGLGDWGGASREAQTIHLVFPVDERKRSSSRTAGDPLLGHQQPGQNLRS